jgi:ubiquinone/menaquinone biosynthesis C-methylase UbiE
MSTMSGSGERTGGERPLYETHYVHGTDAEEQDRLSLLNDLLNERCLTEMHLRPGQRILDVGSGLAQFTRMMARAVGPEGAVLGIEGDPRQMREALRKGEDSGESLSVELRSGDAVALPLSSDEWGTFDIVHARFLLEHVRDPLQVVRQMAQAVRSGGRVILADDDHDILRLWPDPPEVTALWEAYTRMYNRLGNDPLVGRKLVSLMHRAGLHPSRSRWLSFGSCAGDPLFRGYAANLQRVLGGARDAMISHKVIGEAEFDRSLESFRKWSELPDAVIWYGLCWAEAARR